MRGGIVSGGALLLVVLVCGVFVAASHAESAAGGDAPSSPAEQLIVFIDSSGSALQVHFRDETLPELEALADELGVALSVVDVSEAGGSPPGVGLTPLIAFQNWRGRSIYQGRYETLDRVRNFVRTARFMPQGDDKLVREALPAWDRGRATLVTPIKVTATRGPGADAFDLKPPAITGHLASGMERFEVAERVELGRSDRQWYMDFHPYVAEDGTLFVSSELYSQFHCHEPVASWLDDPVSGPVDEPEQVFAAAAARAEAEIVRLLAESELGDGFDVVEVPETSWENLGFALPERPAGNTVDAGDVELVRSWRVDTAAQEQTPAVQFAFPAPLDGYSGEATDITGEVVLGDGLKLADSTGTFTADPASVTMGESDLDAYIHSGLLEVGKFDSSSFTFDRVDVDEAFADQPMSFGTIVPAVLHGEFTMKDVTLPLSVPMSVEAYVGDDGRPRLSFTGSWSLDLMEHYGIEGPPGDDAIRHTLRYACRIVLEPAGE